MSGHNPELWRRTEPLLQTDFLVREKIPHLLGNIKNKRILDAGCGEGYVSRMLAKLGAKVDGVDNDTRMIELAKSLESKSHRTTYRIADILELSKIYKKNEFDIVLLSGVTPFFNENGLLKAFTNIFNVLKKGGILLLTTNHTRSYFEKAKSNWIEFLSKPDSNLSIQKFKINFYTPDRQKAFTGKAWIHTPEQIKKLLEKSGFEIESVHEPLATESDMGNYPEMWEDEDKIPFHLIIIGRRM